MRVSSNTEAQTLSTRHWWVLTFVLLVALPVILSLNFMNEVFAWYTEHFVEPGIQRSLGFTGGEVTIHPGKNSFAWLSPPYLQAAHSKRLVLNPATFPSDINTAREPA